MRRRHWKLGTAGSFDFVAAQEWRAPSALPVFPAAVALAPRTGLLLELGVWTGGTIREMAGLFGKQDDELGRTEKRTLHGFDSFRGLPADWDGRDKMVKGTFDLGGSLPSVPGNVELHAGWFNESLPPFIASHLGDNVVSFLHVDCNLYASASEALRLLVPHFVAGTVVLFDDWLFHDGWDLGESRAWREVSAEAGVEFAYISWHMQRVLVQVTAATAARQEL